MRYQDLGAQGDTTMLLRKARLDKHPQVGGPWGEENACDPVHPYGGLVHFRVRFVLVCVVLEFLFHFENLFFPVFVKIIAFLLK